MSNDTTDLDIERFAADNNINRDDMMLGTVLAGVILHMGADPHIRAMLEANDRDRFIEGCQADVTFPAKFADALMAVREAATA